MPAPTTLALRARADEMGTLGLLLTASRLRAQPGSNSEAGRTRARSIAVIRRIVDQRWAASAARGRAYLAARG